MGHKIPNKNILELIDKVVPLLSDSGIPFWLGRGVLGDYLVNGELKCEHSDVDFHIWKKDRETLRNIFIPVFESENYSKEDEKYKLAFKKPSKKPEYYIEFVYLSDDPENEFVYHESCREIKTCPKKCFPKNDTEMIMIGNHEIPSPSYIEEYFSGIYKKVEWRKEYENCLH